MSSTNLEQNGKLAEFVLAELLAEASNACLSGSLRLNFAEQKIVIYLENGAICFAASNLRNHRLSELLQQHQIVSSEDLSYFTNVSDMELGAKLCELGKISASDLAKIQTRQITLILRTALNWTSGDWVFSALARIRENLRVGVDARQVVLDAVREISAENLDEKFALEDSFSLTNQDANFDLQPREAYILSRFDGVQTFGELSMICGLPERELAKILFSLWCGGFVQRDYLRRAFSLETLNKFRDAKIEMRPNASNINAPIVETKIAPVANVETKPAQVVDDKKEIEIFLARITNAMNFYEVLNVAPNAEASEIKQTYFSLAKRFHPDKYHQAETQLHQRLQSAFPKISQAYEALKDAKSRELYDFKLKKQESLRNNAAANPQTASDFYTQGVNAFESKNYQQAILSLSHAVQLEPNTAGFRVAYGRALATNQKYRLQAESELQTAIKLNEQNPESRLALAEFYAKHNLPKRAEGELKKILSIHPNHAEARKMLSNLS